VGPLEEYPDGTADYNVTRIQPGISSTIERVGYNISTINRYFDEDTIPMRVNENMTLQTEIWWELAETYNWSSVRVTKHDDLLNFGGLVPATYFHGSTHFLDCYVDFGVGYSDLTGILYYFYTSYVNYTADTDVTMMKSLRSVSENVCSSLFPTLESNINQTEYNVAYKGERYIPITVQNLGETSGQIFIQVSLEGGTTWNKQWYNIDGFETKTVPFMLPSYFSDSFNTYYQEIGSYNLTIQVHPAVDGTILQPPYPNAWNYVYFCDIVLNIIDPEINHIPPTINSPVDFEYEYGEKEHSITWIPFDDNATESRIYKNNVLVDVVFWDNNQIVVHLDMLVVGVYNYTIVVYDAYCNSVTDTVFVTVFESNPTSTTTTTGPTTSQPTTSTPVQNDNSLLLIMGGIGGVGVLVAGVALSKKRK